jgi:CheY-like chemotaxis protein
MDTPQTKNRLLLVDGDPKSLRVLDVSLKKAGFDVTTATSGPEALASLETELPDLIISDTDLADMDGFELCSRIKGKATWAKIPFLFVSGRKSIEDKIRGLELGVDDYLTKPIYIKEIGVRVRTALQRAERERMESRREGRTRFAGTLSDVGVVDLIQTIEINRKSGIIHIVNRDERRGSIFFRDGRVIDAEVGRLSGAYALYRLFSWSEGQFAVEFKHIRRHDIVDTPVATLLMEGMRRLDEATHLLEHLPSYHHVLEVDCRVLAEELAELPDEVNSVLRLCDGARTLQEVVEDSDQPDLETLGIISKLYLGQIIFAREAPGQGGESQPGVRLANWLSEGGAEASAFARERVADVQPLLPGQVPTDAPGPSAGASPASPAPEPMLSAEETLGAALPPRDDAEGKAGAAAAPPTLKGVPVETLFSEPEAASPRPPVAEVVAPPAAADGEAPEPPRSTAPMGLAERLLSGDSALRATTMHELMSESDGRVNDPVPVERHTHPYGNPVTQAAAALVQEVVSSTHTSTPQGSPPSRPERPTKEVDWGAWPAVASPPPRPEPQAATKAAGALASTAAAEGPPASTTSSPELDATELADLEPGDGPAPEPEISPAAEPRPRPEGSGEAPIRLGPEDVMPMEGEPAAAASPSSAAQAAPPREAEASIEADQKAPLALVPSPPAETGDDAESARATGGARSRADASSESLRALAESSQAGRVWLLVIAAFGLGVVGFLALSRQMAPREETPSAAPAPAPATAKTAAPSAGAVVPPPAAAPAKPAPVTGATATTATGRESPAAEAKPAPAAAEAKPAPAAVAEAKPALAGLKPAGLAPDNAALRQKCLDTNANGKGRAKAVAAACRPVLEAEPDDAEVMVILARVEIDRGRLGEARSLAKRALAADPQRLEAYVYLGTAEQAAGKVEDARAAYKKYLELAPDGPFARELRAILSNL